MRRTRDAVTAGLATILLALALAIPVSAAQPTDTSDLRDAVTVEGIREHQTAFQAIADANDDTRASGTPGYDASADYVAERLTDAGYEVTRQQFDFPFFEEQSAPMFERTQPTSETYTEDEDFATMTFSGSGDVTAPVVPVDLALDDRASSTSGCEAADFDGVDVSGDIALMQRGACTFAQKASNAEAAGAAAAVVFNQGNTEEREALFFGTLGEPGIGIPVLSASFPVGEELAADGTEAHVVVDAISEIRPTENVIADTATGRDDRTVVVGGHLDSVTAGPGINDNGSGVATILEVAEQMAELDIEPRNRVRFAFWGAEEFGLLGSEHYVSNLPKRERKDIALNLNFDMLGSPNYVRFVYDGDGSDTPLAGPTGSAQIEQVFLDYFESQGLETAPTPFSGRSDYGPFIARGIPAGGLFSGAEGIKTEEQVAIYGGTAGEQYDPCYHLACDDLDNVSLDALDEMSDAVAHSVLTFAQTRSAVSGTDRAVHPPQRGHDPES